MFINLYISHLAVKYSFLTRIITFRENKTTFRHHVLILHIYDGDTIHKTVKPWNCVSSILFQNQSISIVFNIFFYSEINI